MPHGWWGYMYFVEFHSVVHCNGSLLRVIGPLPVINKILPFQLRHTFSNKYIHVSTTEMSPLECDKMKVTIILARVCARDSQAWGYSLFRLADFLRIFIPLRFMETVEKVDQLVRGIPFIPTQKWAHFRHANSLLEYTQRVYMQFCYLLRF